jgi:hypothetical protein
LTDAWLPCEPPSANKGGFMICGQSSMMGR